MSLAFIDFTVLNIVKFLIGFLYVSPILIIPLLLILHFRKTSEKKETKNSK